jgi:hypothetical protein
MPALVLVILRESLLLGVHRWQSYSVIPSEVEGPLTVASVSEEKTKLEIPRQARDDRRGLHSHSIVLGGLVEMS